MPNIDEKRLAIKKQLIKNEINKRRRAAMSPDERDEDVAEEKWFKNRDPFKATAEGLWRGMADYASFGLSDEIEGTGKAVARSIENGEPFLDTRKEEINKADQTNKDAEAAFPVGYHGAGLIGLAGQSLIPGAAALNSAKAGRAAEGGSAVWKAMKAAGKGGALMGFGNSDASIVDGEIPKLVADTAEGGVAGMGLGAGLHGAGKFIGKLNPTKIRDSLKKFAETRAVKGAGAMTKEMRELEKAGFLRDTGRALLDDKVVTPLASLDDVATRAGAIKEKAGQEIGGAIKQADDFYTNTMSLIDRNPKFQNIPDNVKQAMKSKIQGEYTFSMKGIADKIRGLAKENSGMPQFDNEVQKLYKLADSFEEKGLKTFKEGHAVKKAQRKVTKWGSETVPQSFQKEISKIVNEELESKIAKMSGIGEAIQSVNAGNRLGANVGANPADMISDVANKTASKFKDANKKYAQMKYVEDMANKRQGMQNSNRMMSLTDTIAGVGGLAHAGAPGAMAMSAGNKLARKYGATLPAVVADKLSDKKTLKFVEGLANKAGFEKWAPKLKTAMQQGNPALVSTHMYLYENDPEYRRAVDSDKAQNTLELYRQLKEAK